MQVVAVDPIFIRASFLSDVCGCVLTLERVVTFSQQLTFLPATVSHHVCVCAFSAFI